MLADLPMGGFKVTGLGTGTAAGDAVTKAQLDAIVSALTQHPGEIGVFARTTAPSGWIKANGGSIGNAASGGTARANADTVNLFSLLWAQFSDAILPIQTSTGSASTRGASAAADYAANKRLIIPDLRGEFIRGWDDTRGVDTSRVLGSSQADLLESHTHSVTGSTNLTNAHDHGLLMTTADISPNAGSGTAIRTSSSSDLATNGTLAHSHTVTGTAAASGGTETRPRNVAFLICIKL